MDPITWFVIFASLAAAASAANLRQSGKAAKSAADYTAQTPASQAKWNEYEGQVQANAAREQADWAEYNAAMSEIDSNIKKERHEGDVAKLLSTQRARFGKSGILLTGTPLDIMADTMYQADIDSLLLENEATTEITNWKNEAGRYRHEADMALLEGSNSANVNRAKASLNLLKGQTAKSQGNFGAGTTILTGATRVAGAYIT